MPDLALRLIFGALLVATAVAKLRSPAASRAALGETFGVTVPAMRPLIWASVIAVELALGLGVAFDVGGAAYAAAALMAVLRRSWSGRSCVARPGALRLLWRRFASGWLAVLRNLVLAAIFASLPALSDVDLATDTWLGIGLGVALIACAALAFAVFALAREIGSLRMRVGPESALELPGEGPELGSRTSLISEFGEREEAGFALAVFTSPACQDLRRARAGDRDPRRASGAIPSQLWRRHRRRRMGRDGCSRQSLCCCDERRGRGVGKGNLQQPRAARRA